MVARYLPRQERRPSSLSPPRQTRPRRPPAGAGLCLVRARPAPGRGPLSPVCRASGVCWCVARCQARAPAGARRGHVRKSPFGGPRLDDGSDLGTPCSGDGGEAGRASAANPEGRPMSRSAREGSRLAPALLWRLCMHTPSVIYAKMGNPVADAGRRTSPCVRI